MSSKRVIALPKLDTTDRVTEVIKDALREAKAEQSGRGGKEKK